MKTENKKKEFKPQPRDYKVIFALLGILNNVKPDGNSFFGSPIINGDKKYSRLLIQNVGTAIYRGCVYDNGERYEDYEISFISDEWFQKWAEHKQAFIELWQKAPIRIKPIVIKI